jgi:hypothetical protein
MADNPFDFTGRTALVTGSGRDKGMGFAGMVFPQSGRERRAFRSLADGSLVVN